MQEHREDQTNRRADSMMQGDKHAILTIRKQKNGKYEKKLRDEVMLRFLLVSSLFVLFVIVIKDFDCQHASPLIVMLYISLSANKTSLRIAL